MCVPYCSLRVARYSLSFVVDCCGLLMFVLFVVVRCLLCVAC